MKMLKLDKICDWYDKNASFASIPLRLTLGLLFLMNGYGKLNALPGITAFFGNLGIPAPGIMATVVAWSEFIGGILLLAGLFTRFVAGLLSIILVVALLTAHRTALLAFDVKGMGVAFVCLGGMVALKIMGSGPLSLDRVIFKKKHSEEHKK